jgi:transcriptional regulator with XRE-family HTH domain
LAKAPRQTPEWVSSPVHREVITALVSARNAIDMRQRELAEKMGKPRSFVGKVEAIERNLSVMEFIAWTRALGLSRDEVLKILNP